MIRIKHDEKEIKIGFLITGLVIIILFANLIYLNFQFLNSNDNSATVTEAVELQEEEIAPTVNDILPTPKGILPTSSPIQNTTARTKISFKNYYINLGSGSNRSTEWVDVNGTLSTFDIADYKNIQEARLETTTNAPIANGTMSVRLFNKTGKHAVWNSNRTVQAEIQGSLLISEKLNYDSGPSLYSVQIKSQLGIEINLIQARIRIVAE